MINTSFSPRQSTEYIIQKWWVLVLFMFVGAGIGSIFNGTHPEIYQSHLEFTAQVDFTQTGPLPLLSQDQLMGTVHYLLIAPPMMTELSALLAEQQGINISPEELNELQTVEREYRIWRMYFRHADPELINQVAPVYWELVQIRFAEYLESAIEARMWQAYINDLTLCDSLHAGDPNLIIGNILPAAAGTPLPPFEVECSLPDDLNLEAEFQLAAANLELAMAEAAGLSPSLMLDFLAPPTDATPVSIYDPGLLIFAGAMIGFIVGISVLSIWSSKLEKDSHAG